MIFLMDSLQRPQIVEKNTNANAESKKTHCQLCLLNKKENATLQLSIFCEKVLKKKSIY